MKLLSLNSVSFLIKNNHYKITYYFFLKSKIKSSLILSSSCVYLTSAKAEEAFLAIDSLIVVKFFIVCKAVASTFYKVCTSFSNS